MATKTDAQILDEVAEILREPEWDGAADYLDDIFNRVTQVRDCSTRYCTLCGDPIVLIDGGDWQGSRCVEHLNERR